MQADPHPGNLIRTPDGRLALLDFGLVTTVDDNIKYGMIEAISHLIHRFGSCDRASPMRSTSIAVADIVQASWRQQAMAGLVSCALEWAAFWQHTATEPLP